MQKPKTDLSGYVLVRDRKTLWVMNQNVIIGCTVFQTSVQAKQEYSRRTCAQKGFPRGEKRIHHNTIEFHKKQII